MLNKCLVGICLIVVCAGMAWAAAVPQTLTYHGYLRNTDGTPVNVATNVKFGLYSSTSGAGPVWNSGPVSVTPAAGIYSMQLGPINLPFDRPYWLGVTAGTDPEMRPLQALTSAPYAVRATMADSLAAGAVTTSGIADGSVTDAKITGPITGSKLGAHSHSGNDINSAISLANGGTGVATGLTALSASSLTSGTVPDNRLSNNISLLNAAQMVTGAKTFSAPIASTVATGTAPLAVASSTKVVNLNAEMVGGQSLENLDVRYKNQLAPNPTSQQLAMLRWDQVRSSNPTINVGYFPSALTYDGTNLWVVIAGNGNTQGMVQKINPGNGAISPGITVGRNPQSILFDGTNIWVGNINDMTAQKIDPKLNVAGPPIFVGGSPYSFVFDGTSLWVGLDNGIRKINPNTYALDAPITTGFQGLSLAFDGTNIWSTAGNNVVKIDPASNTVSAPIALSGFAYRLRFDGKKIWVGNYFDNAVQYIGIDTNTASSPVSVSSPNDLVFDGTNIWVANYSNSTVQKIDPATNMVSAPISISPVYPQSLAFDGANIWAAGSNQVIKLSNAGIQVGAQTVGTAQIVNNAITTAALADGSVTDAKITGPISGSKISGNISGNAATATTATSFTGMLAGDVTGTQSSTIVAKIQGTPISNTTPGTNQIMKFNGTSWAPATGNWAASGANPDITSLSGLTTPLSVGQGGTGAATAAAARTSLGAASSGANSDITSLSGLTTALSVTQGGTGSTTAPGARTSLAVPGLATANTFTIGAQTIQTGADANRGLIVKANSVTQSANLQEWQNSTGSSVASVGPSGSLTLTGNLNLPATGAIYSGANRLLHYFGSSNFFAGIYAGNMTMSGNSNAATGYSALYSNTSGNYNTADGAYALYLNTTGSNNTANGRQALYSNTSGYVNTASGAQALYFNTAGNYNAACGGVALYANTTGNSNTAMGAYALMSNTTANANTAVGTNALQAQSFSNAGTPWDSFNTAVGYEALYSNSPISTNGNDSGNDNTALGAAALRANTTGYGNTGSGAKVLYSNTQGIANIASGAKALYLNTTGSFNNAIGYAALYNNLTGWDNTAIGYTAGQSIVSSDRNTFLGHSADSSGDGLFNATAIGAKAIVNASNKVRIGDTAVTVIEGQVGWSYPSDIRLKKDVADVTHGLGFIKALRPVEYRLKEGNGKKDFGFIAQEVEQLIGTDYNLLGIGENSERTLSLRYTDLIAPMVKAIQEQQMMINLQSTVIDQLKADLAELKRLIGI